MPKAPAIATPSGKRANAQPPDKSGRLGRLQRGLWAFGAKNTGDDMRRRRDSSEAV